jgi:hypothetical protein
MVLTQAQQSALQNLAHKKAGREVGWITIADARSLTELALAKRNSSGWWITAQGEALLEEVSKTALLLDFKLYNRP